MDFMSENSTRLDLFMLLDLIGAPHPTFINVIDPATGFDVKSRGLSGLRLSEFVQISEFFRIYITYICQTSESFTKGVNLK